MQRAECLWTLQPDDSHSDLVLFELDGLDQQTRVIGETHISAEPRISSLGESAKEA